MKTMMEGSGPEIVQDATAADYGEEIMSAGWNPAVELVCELLLGSPQGATPGNPTKFASIK